MAKKMLKCPYCNSDLQLRISYTGADWDTVAGDGSGYGWPIELNCTNDSCATIFPLVHAKEMHHVSVVKEEYRHFKNYNL
ncbi:hypothetical protein P4H32_32385 [Bacillus cereus]|nr:hypothetical protein [Bacillus cereus]